MFWNKIFGDGSGMSGDDYDMAALRIVNNKIASPFSINGCDDVLASIPKLRQEFADTEPPILRRKIMEWLNYRERRAREIRANFVRLEKIDKYLASRDSK